MLMVLPAMTCDVGVDGGVVERVGGYHGQGDVGVLEGEERGGKKAESADILDKEDIDRKGMSCLSEYSSDVEIIQVHWGHLGHLQKSLTEGGWD